MPLLGSIMTIAVDNPTTASTSVFEGNMTWSRPVTGGSTFPSNEALSTRAIPNGKQHRRPAVTATSGRVSRLLGGKGAEKGSSKNAAKNNEKHVERDGKDERNGTTTTGKEGVEAIKKEASHRCDRTSETQICGRNTVGAAKSSGETAFTGEEKGAGLSTGGGSSEQSVDSIGSTTDSVSVSTGILNSTEEEVAIEYGKDLLLFGFSDTMEDAINSFNDSFNGSSRHSWNISLYNNETLIVFGEGMYPSGYTLPHIILASILATLLMIVIVVGNMLVIIAIATEKALKNIQNWFIASLAVADFFLGLVIMPFSLVNEIMGYWIFGYWWCDIHSAMDVLLCTASIMNLCLISLDRFWSITQAVDYLKKRTPARAALMIALVWILSALVCIPPLLGWKRPTPEEEYPKCELSEDIGYVLYSALGSFYIPSCIMVFVYIRIYFAAKARARRGIRKQPRPRVVPPESPDIRQTSFTQSTPATDTKKPPGSVMENVATIENQPVQIPIVTCDFASDVSTSEADPGGGTSIPMEEKDTLKVSIPIPAQKSNLKATLSVNGDGQTGGQKVPASASASATAVAAAAAAAVAARCRAPSVGIDVDMVSEFDPSSSDSGVVSRCAVVKPLKLRLCQPIFGRKHVGKSKREHADVGRHAGKDESDGKMKQRDPEREKRRLARKKEKRATMILGFIMGSFIACWLPFFVLYIVKPIFPDFEIPSQAFVIAFWLGYTNSALNPFIYTVFNKDFRRAFRRILFK
ncbi:PREDICTED: alpha-2B adrenergic receptor isoform X1 [Trachymyrmex septentrionalis]|uniref:alpha-2B adrenergic receptor isoform X1 n=1 Tax=Trachymyrmex septentrionalis TaxID=34720 RepID=UPI00084F7AF8|nr:PREDICTED: alpha-2B adrenergic receptor isoform X1 [Trachymyrmex septentrionalis]